MTGNGFLGLQEYTIEGKAAVENLLKRLKSLMMQYGAHICHRAG